MQRRAAEESLTDHGKDNSNGRAHVGDAIRHKPGILGFLRQIGFMGATPIRRPRGRRHSSPLIKWLRLHSQTAAKTVWPLCDPQCDGPGGREQHENPTARHGLADHSRDRTTQKRRSAIRSDGLAPFRSKAASCCRRARFSRCNAARLRKASRTMARTIRMVVHMSETLSGTSREY